MQHSRWSPAVNLLSDTASSLRPLDEHPLCSTVKNNEDESMGQARGPTGPGSRTGLNPWPTSKTCFLTVMTFLPVASPALRAALGISTHLFQERCLCSQLWEHGVSWPQHPPRRPQSNRPGRGPAPARVRGWSLKPEDPLGQRLVLGGPGAGADILCRVQPWGTLANTAPPHQHPPGRVAAPRLPWPPRRCLER